MTQKSECLKHFKKIESSVFLSFNPQQEVNLEFLWHVGLKAMSCPPHEFIPWVAVEKVLQTTGTHIPSIPLRPHDTDRYPRYDDGYD
jgi:hypothetical protein